jgi:outer membrane protein assembly factor BamE (lipoprotein component of BamABCDE complex)
MNHGVLIIPLVLLVACFPKIDPSKVGRVEQNFDNIEPGMTKDEVRELVGEPIKEGTITYDYANHPPKTSNVRLICKLAPCSWDAWALEAKPEDFNTRPIVIFDRNTHRVTQTLRDELELYFRDIKRVKILRLPALF